MWVIEGLKIEHTDAILLDLCKAFDKVSHWKPDKVFHRKPDKVYHRKFKLGSCRQGTLIGSQTRYPIGSCIDRVSHRKLDNVSH